MMRLRGFRAKARFWRALRDDAGSAGVEFALIAPVFVLIIAGIFEIGLVTRTKFALISVVSAAANQTLTLGDSINDGSAETIATTLAELLGGEGRSGMVDINNAVVADLHADQVTLTVNGPAASACYCAARPGGQIVWGSPVDCGSPCGGGSQSGRFVVLTAEAPFTSSLGLYGFFDEDVVRNTAVVRLP